MPKPIFVNDEGGINPLVIDSEEGERTASDLNTKKRRANVRDLSAVSRSDDRAPDVELIMVENWEVGSASGPRQSFWDSSINFATHNKLYNWLEPDVERFEGVGHVALGSDAEGLLARATMLVNMKNVKTRKELEQIGVLQR